MVFIPQAVPGDRVRARVTRKKKRHVEAGIVEILEASPLRADPPCSYFGACGGCKWQHVAYQSQLDAKTESVRDALIRVGGFEQVEVRLALGSKRTYRYRNKMEFTFGSNRWLTRKEIDSGCDFDTDFALGLHAPGRFDKVLDLHECHLHAPESHELVNRMRTLVREHGWKPWRTDDHTGFLRHLVIRTGAHAGETMVNLVTNGFDRQRMDIVSGFLRRTFPHVTTFVNTINTGKAQVAYGESVRTIFGPGVIHDRIGPYTFEISPAAFFQTNTVQAERLYETARAFAEPEPDDVLYDLYCGAGTFSIFVAKDVRRVVGIEWVGDAVRNAQANAIANGIDNCTFVAGDILQQFDQALIEREGAPDVLVVDPPRVGLHPKVVDRIRHLGPDRFVYVSCNPRTQARDLGLLKDVYRIEAVQPVDLFPHTHHMESVVKLRRLSGASIGVPIEAGPADS